METKTKSLIGIDPGITAAIISSIASAAIAVGTSLDSKQNTTGCGESLKLNFGDEKGENSYEFLISPEAKIIMEMLARVIFIREKTKYPNSDDNDIALRAKMMIKNVLDSTSKTTQKEMVANGEGGTGKKTPWGSAKINCIGGNVAVSSFETKENELINIAEGLGLPLTADIKFDFLSLFQISYDFKENDPWYRPDDNIYVRGEELSWKGIGCEIIIQAKVAFDWDDDTTYYQWSNDDKNAIQPGVDIKDGKWIGNSDPDD